MPHEMQLSRGHGSQLAVQSARLHHPHYPTATLTSVLPGAGAAGAERSVLVWEPRKWALLDRWSNCLKYEATGLHFSSGGWWVCLRTEWDVLNWQCLGMLTQQRWYRNGWAVAAIHVPLLSVCRRDGHVQAHSTHPRPHLNRHFVQATRGCASWGAWTTRCCAASGAATRPAAWAAATARPMPHTPASRRARQRQRRAQRRRQQLPGALGGAELESQLDMF